MRDVYEHWAVCNTYIFIRRSMYPTRVDKQILIILGGYSKATPYFTMIAPGIGCYTAAKSNTEELGIQVHKLL